MKQEKEEKDGVIKGLEDNLKVLDEKKMSLEEAIEEKKREAKKMEEVIEASKTKNNVNNIFHICWDLRKAIWLACSFIRLHKYPVKGAAGT